jgi:hypothetical protein
MTVQLTGATIFLDDDAEQRRMAFTTCVTLGGMTQGLGSSAARCCATHWAP